MPSVPELEMHFKDGFLSGRNGLHVVIDVASIRYTYTKLGNQHSDKYTHTDMTNFNYIFLFSWFCSHSLVKKNDLNRKKKKKATGTRFSICVNI